MILQKIMLIIGVIYTLKLLYKWLHFDTILQKYLLMPFLQCELVTYLYIKAAKLFFNIPREKLSPRPLAAEVGNLEDVKKFRRQSVHNIFGRKFVIIINRTKLT
jgi:hypothetical protein